MGLRRVTLAALTVSALTGCAAGNPDAAKVGGTIRLGARTATVQRMDVLPYVESNYTERFVFDTYENPKLTLLRTKHGLAEVVAPGKDEFEKQLLLMSWVRKQIPGGDPKGLGDMRNALEILDLSKKGQRFFCVQYASVYISAAASLGWVARPIALRRPDRMRGSSSEHSSTEVWSNQHRKWVMLDPTFDLYVEDGNGLPLNSWEIRRDFFYNDANSLVFVNRRSAKRYRKADGGKPYPAQLYAFIGYVPNTNFLDAKADWGRMFISRTDDEVCKGTTWHARDCPKDPAVDPYFPINQAALTLAPDGQNLKVTIRTMTPNFKEFQVRIDGGQWRRSEDSFGWALNAGTNTLEARAVNKFGVAGPVSTVQLEVR
jgi:hypothetical protein